MDVLGVRLLQISCLDVWNATYEISLGTTYWILATELEMVSNFGNIFILQKCTKTETNKILTGLTYSKAIYNIYIFYANFTYIRCALIAVCYLRQSCVSYISSVSLINKYVSWWSVLIETCKEFIKMYLLMCTLSCCSFICRL